jgi:hypothetical protein
MPCCTSHPPTTPSSNPVDNSRRFVNEPSRSSYDHAAWNLIPTMVWASVTRWLTCTERRVVRRVMRAFVTIRYRYAQCTCLKRPSQVLRTLSDARYIFWDRFNDCILSFVPHPPLPEAWADEPYVSRLTQHYAGWATRLRHAYERWVQRVNDFRWTHCMYDGDLPTVVLNEHAYPHDEFTIVDGVKHVRFRLNHWSCSMKYVCNGKRSIDTHHAVLDGGVQPISFRLGESRGTTHMPGATATQNMCTATSNRPHGCIRCVCPIHYIVMLSYCDFYMDNRRDDAWSCYLIVAFTWRHIAMLSS